MWPILNKTSPERINHAMEKPKRDHPYHDTAYNQSRRKLHQIYLESGYPLILLNIIMFPADVLMLVYRAFMDDDFSIWMRLELVLAMLYFAVPDDLIPDFLPGIGIIDDILLGLRVIYNLFSTIKDGDDDVLEDYWAGDPAIIKSLDNFVSTYGKWASRLILLMTIFKILTILAGS